MSSIVLNSAQQNRIRTVLWSLDRDCAEIERLIDAEVDAGLVQIHNDLTAAEQATLRAQVGAIRQQVHELAVELQLSPHVLDVRRHALGALTIDWSALVDTLPQKLGRYGAVDAEAATFLQPRLEQLINSLEMALQVRAE